MVPMNSYNVFPFRGISKVGKIWKGKKQVLDWNMEYIVLYFDRQFPEHFYTH